MRRILQGSAIILAGATLIYWAAAGASRGWTKTLIPVTVSDPVTGLDNVVMKKGFVPGVDFLVVAFLAAGLLLGVSFFCKSRPKKA